MRKRASGSGDGATGLPPLHASTSPSPQDGLSAAKPITGRAAGKPTMGFAMACRKTRVRLNPSYGPENAIVDFKSQCDFDHSSRRRSQVNSFRDAGAHAADFLACGWHLTEVPRKLPGQRLRRDQNLCRHSGLPQRKGWPYGRCRAGIGRRRNEFSSWRPFPSAGRPNPWIITKSVSRLRHRWCEHQLS